ncbi:MAG: hypothetical protein ACYCZX_17250 [Rhodospirillaceae bacterium]
MGFRYLAMAAAAVLLSGCADFDAGQLFQRTAANTAASACRSASNCSTNRRDPTAAPQPWEQGAGARGKHDPFHRPVPTP